MKQMSWAGKFFFGVALVISFVAIALCKRGEWALGAMTFFVAVLEFALAYSSTKLNAQRVRG